VGEQPRDTPLPPHRKWWVERMSIPDRHSYLIAEELEQLAVSRRGEASSAVRRFLIAWRRWIVHGTVADSSLAAGRIHQPGPRRPLSMVFVNGGFAAM
jgi:hypothetical protein